VDAAGGSARHAAGARGLAGQRAGSGQMDGPGWADNKAFRAGLFNLGLDLVGRRVGLFLLRETTSCNFLRAVSLMRGTATFRCETAPFCVTRVDARSRSQTASSWETGTTSFPGGPKGASGTRETASFHLSGTASFPGRVLEALEEVPLLKTT
jgi:hypothetical protein